MNYKTRDEWIQSVPIDGKLALATMPSDTGLVDLIRGHDDRVRVEQDNTAMPIEPLGYGVTIIRVK